MIKSLSLSKKVALVLGSGGARGMAHIGVIEELEKYGYEITSIAGTSVGSIVGGFYARGKLQEFKEWVLQLDKMDVFSLFDFTFDTQGLIRGDRIFKRMERFVHDCLIEELPIPFCAVAADIAKGEEKVFSKGRLFQAIRASSAIPTIMTPVKLDGSELVDGGVLSPLPLKYVKRNPEDILVAVDVSAQIPYESSLKSQEAQEVSNEYLQKLNDFISKWKSTIPSSREKVESNNMFTLMNKSFKIMQSRLSQQIVKDYPPDFLVKVSRNACGTFELYRAAELIEAGRAAFHRAMDKDTLKLS